MGAGPEHGSPYSPEEAADIVFDELMADRGTSEADAGTSEKVREEAEEAARQVEADEEAD